MEKKDERLRTLMLMTRENGNNRRTSFSRNNPESSLPLPL